MQTFADWKASGTQPITPATPTPLPSFSTWKASQPTEISSPNFISDVGTALVTPTKPQSFFKTIADTWGDAVNRMDESAAVMADPKGSLLDTTVAGGRTIVGAVNVLFSPITAALNSASGIPVVGVVADGLNRVFAALGAGGGGAVRDTINALPIPQDVKNSILPNT